MRPSKQHTEKRTYDMGEDDRDIDFSSVGLYLVGIQTVVATTLVSLSSVLCCWLVPQAAVSAVRTLCISTAVGVGCVFRPMRLGRVRGVNTIFNALRPSVLIYIQALVLEQLVHTCAADSMEEIGTWRRVVFHVTVFVMILAGFIRAKTPKSESDLPFMITGACLCVVALFPPPPQMNAGPLCSSPTALQAGERLLRAFMFATMYVVHVYSAAPDGNTINELCLCVMRCAAAVVWVLGASAWVLPLAVAQVTICAYTRINIDDPFGAFRREEVLPFNSHGSDADPSECYGYQALSNIPGLSNNLSMLGSLTGLPPTPAQLAGLPVGTPLLTNGEIQTINYDDYDPDNPPNLGTLDPENAPVQRIILFE